MIKLIKPRIENYGGNPSLVTMLMSFTKWKKKIIFKFYRYIGVYFIKKINANICQQITQIKSDMWILEILDGFLGMKM